MDSDIPEVDAVPALLYHKVSPSWEVGVTCVTPDQFRRHMQAVADAGWRTAEPALPLQVTKREPGSGRRFILAFDDGYECVHEHALPVLADIGFTALIFIPTAYIGNWNDWDHHLLGRRFRHVDERRIADLVSAGWVIGSHTVSHRYLPNLAPDILAREMNDSRRRLQDLAGQAVEWVSFPFSRYSERVVAAATQAGYRGAVVPVRRETTGLAEGLTLVEADAVYTFDSASRVSGILDRRRGYRANRFLRRFANSLCIGTVLWKRLFTT